MTAKDTLPSLAAKLADKFKTRFAVVRRLKKAVEDSYNRAANTKPATECCKAEKSKLQYNTRFRSLVDVNNFCAQISSTASPNPVHLDVDFEHLMRAHKSVLYFFRTFHRKVDNSWKISNNRGGDDKKINWDVFLDSSNQS